MEKLIIKLQSNSRKDWTDLKWKFVEHFDDFYFAFDIKSRADKDKFVESFDSLERSEYSEETDINKFIELVADAFDKSLLSFSYNRLESYINELKRV